jgi:hypothetical protein
MMIDDPEDEAFNEIERQAKQRKEAVKALMRKALANELYDSGTKMAGATPSKKWHSTLRSSKALVKTL